MDAEEAAAAAAEQARRQQVDQTVATLRAACAEAQDGLAEAFEALRADHARSALEHWLAQLSSDVRTVLSGDNPGEFFLHCPRALRGQVHSLLDLCLQYSLFTVAQDDDAGAEDAARRPDPERSCVRFLEVYGTLLDFEAAASLFNSRRWHAAQRALEQANATDMKALEDELAALLAPSSGSKDREPRTAGKSSSDRLRALQARASQGPVQAQLRTLRELAERGEAKQAAAFAVQHFPALRLHNVQALSNRAVERPYLDMLLGPQAPVHALAARRDAAAVQRWLELLLEDLPQAAQPPSVSFAAHAELFEEEGGLAQAPASAWPALLASRPAILDDDERLAIDPVSSAFDGQGRPAFPAPTGLTFLVSCVADEEKRAAQEVARRADGEAEQDEAGADGGLERRRSAFAVEMEELCDTLLWCGVWDLYERVAVHCEVHHRARIKVAVRTGNMDELKRACRSVADWQIAMRLGLTTTEERVAVAEQMAADVRRVVLSMAFTLGPRAALEGFRQCLEELKPVGFEKEAYLICKDVLAAHVALEPLAEASREVLAAADSYLWSQRPAALPPQLALLLEQSLADLNKKYGRSSSQGGATPTLSLTEAREVLQDRDLARTLEDPHTHWGVSTQLSDTVCAASGLPLRAHYAGDGVLVSANGQLYLPSYADLANPL